MIKQFNPDKLSKQPFFIDLINFLYLNQPVTLREIKKEFSSQDNLDRLIEEFVKANYIERSNKRYSLLISFVSDVSTVDLDQHLVIDDATSLYQELIGRRFRTKVLNSTNDVIIQEYTSITRDDNTISNYFYKLRENLPFSEEQNRLYNLLGDVNPEYFLKYVTTFLLKFVRKDVLLQKRRNIFVDALEILGYIIQVEEGHYTLNMDLDIDGLVYSTKKD
ncbi:DUF1803 domain-containing protein [Streptococcus raffinosi]|uniref:DUF1803 domain-containing protein n=1 Tax=Streptococcus raffinosi TaxID=3053355 RepID=A0ABT7LUI4_9STRE|nr:MULTISPECIES: DUF1803 domain-containing protein [unclassified Streptococcus]MDL5044306.1 DUF1803 domain-containing protein [Streptococcus sp. VTCC 12812]MDM0095513.1 DUF1803 domain-containing protein [Streptococcus sp. VTCC 12813]